MFRTRFGCKRFWQPVHSLQTDLRPFPQDDSQGYDADPLAGHIAALDCLPPRKAVLTSRVLRPTAITSGQRDGPEHHAQRRAAGEKALDLVAA